MKKYWQRFKEMDRQRQIITVFVAVLVIASAISLAM